MSLSDQIRDLRVTHENEIAKACIEATVEDLLTAYRDWRLAKENALVYNELIHRGVPQPYALPEPATYTCDLTHSIYHDEPWH